jgi:hypothetical protein
VTADAMHWTAPRTDLTFPALLIPPYELPRLGDDSYQGARDLIGCRLIEKTTIEGAGRISIDFLFDEEGGPEFRDDAELNEVATSLGHAVRLSQACGSYPAPADLGFGDLDAMARMWHRHIRLHGPVVIVGADDATGNWVPVPTRLLEFVTDDMGLEVAQ